MNIRTVILSVALALVFVFAARLVVAETKVISEPLSQPADMLAAPEQPSSSNNAPIHSYRSQFGECYDVSIRDLAACRTAIQNPAQPEPRPMDEFYDRSIWDVAACRYPDTCD